MTAARHFELFGYCIPASGLPGGLCETIPGRQRTPYFYRKMALDFWRMARWGWGDPDSFRQTCRSLALSYLKSYRERLAGRQPAAGARPLPLP